MRDPGSLSAAIGHLPLSRRVLVAVVTLFGAGCGDDGVSPSAIAGRFDLVSFNGSPLPVHSIDGTVTHGDLLLRANGTFSMGVGGTGSVHYSPPDTGEYTVSRNQLHLRFPPRAEGRQFELFGSVEGDSVVLDTPPADPQCDEDPFAHLNRECIELRFAFRRARTPTPLVTDGELVLVAVNGTGPPLTLWDTATTDGRWVARVNYDTLSFTDGVFFRQHRSEEQLRYDHHSSEPIAFSADEWSVAGSYTGATDAIILRLYAPPSQRLLANDTLHIVGDALVRRTQNLSQTVEERYERFR